MGFIDFGKAYNRVNRKALWQVLRMYDVMGKLLSGIKSMLKGQLHSKRMMRVIGLG